MKENIKWLAAGIAVIATVLILDYVGLMWFDFIGPKKQNIERRIFKESQPYNEAKLQDLVKYRLEYLRANSQDKKAISSTIRFVFSDFDENNLPDELKTFLKKIKYGSTK